MSYRVSIRSLRIDVEGKTTVPHLWGIGQMTTAGSAHGSWVHGDGLGVAAKTGLDDSRALARESMIQNLVRLMRIRLNVSVREFMNLQNTVENTVRIT